MTVKVKCPSGQNVCLIIVWLEFKNRPLQETFASVSLQEELLREMQIFYTSGCFNPLMPSLQRFSQKQKRFSRLHEVTNLYVWLGSRVLCLDSLGQWQQRFERTLSWDKATWCNLSRDINSEPPDEFDFRSLPHLPTSV